MKTIQLLRHSYTAPGTQDRERQLTPFGERTCALMAQKMLASGASFEHIYASPASRAQSTVQLIAESLIVAQSISVAWLTEESLYTFEWRELQRWLASLEDSIRNVFVVAHNPAISELCATLTGQPITHVKPCSYLRLVADVDHWQALYQNCATLECHLESKPPGC